MRVLGHVRWPRLALLLLASISVTSWYLYLVPRAQWVGLFPSASPERPEQVAVASPRLQAVLDELQANITAVYEQHGAAVPPSVYASQALSDAQEERYRHLQSPTLTRSARIQANALGRTPLPKYMFTTLTRNIGESLPDLLVALATFIDFVGPEHTSFSILEGPSDDLTPVVLEEVLRPLLKHLSVADSAVNIVTNAPKVQWNEVNRIEELAKLRNQALEPLWADSSKQYLASTPEHKRRTVGTDVAAVVFFNDVFLQASDFLELLHQHVVNGQDNAGVGITTAWDWMTREPAYFYDVWVARTVSVLGGRCAPMVFVDFRSTRVTYSIQSATNGGARRKTFSRARPSRGPPLRRSRRSRRSAAGTLWLYCRRHHSCPRLPYASAARMRILTSARPASAR